MLVKSGSVIVDELISMNCYVFFSIWVILCTCAGGRGFVEIKELSVPDTVKSMSWCGENICLGLTRKVYMILNATSGTLSEVFSSGRNALPLVVSLPSGELLLGKVLIA